MLDRAPSLKTLCLQGPGLLTIASLAPVVRGKAVVTLGPHRALPALAEACLIASIVHGADLVTVTFWGEQEHRTCAARVACEHLQMGPARPSLYNPPLYPHLGLLCSVAMLPTRLGCPGDCWHIHMAKEGSV